MQSSFHRRIGVVLGLCLLGVAIGGLAETGRAVSWWKAADGNPSPELGRILGGDLASWTLENSRRQRVSGTVTNILGCPALVGDANGLRLTRHTGYPAGTEVAIRFQFHPKLQETVYFRLALAVQDPSSVNERTIFFSCSIRGGAGNALQCTISDPVMVTSAPPQVVQAVRLNEISERNLGWPEQLRKEIEHESASVPALEDRWFTVRAQLREGGYRIYLDDRILLDRQAKGLATRGMLRVDTTAHTAIGGFSARSLVDISPLYEPVRLDGYVNAGALNGAPVDHAELPPAGVPVPVDGVPFIFAEPDAQSRDHLDVGTSWFQGGYLEGHLYSHNGPFGGRWPDVTSVNPARLRVNLPFRRYRAIHLVAAADNEPNSVPDVTFQFYRPQAGAPVNVPGKVPAFDGKVSGTTDLPVRLKGGRKGNLHHVTIPIDPGVLADFDDLKTLSVEITKAVRLFRGYPDPAFYSYHAAGLPSSVHVYAMTFESAPVQMMVAPDTIAHVWTAPAQPSYTIVLSNLTAKPRPVSITLSTRSYDGDETTKQVKAISVPASGGTSFKIPIPLKRFGYHEVTVVMDDAGSLWTESVSLAYLHQDTRERGNWEPGKGICFGSWLWAGAHGTPGPEEELLVLALAGGECRGGTFQTSPESVKEIARKYGMISLKQFAGQDHYVTAALAGNLTKTTETAAVEMFVKALREIETLPSPITQTRYVSFYPEPHIGPYTSGALPDYFGEPPVKLSAAEQERFDYFLRGLKVGVPVVRKLWPDVKIMFPHGDPMFTALFLRMSKDVAPLIDGIAVDIPVFERLPEQQIHQVTLHRLWMCREEFRKAGKTNMVLPIYEGPCLPTRPGALTQEACANQMLRCALILSAYGVDQFPGAWSVFECSGYWGEQHYGGGLMHRIPHQRPKPVYAAHATMTRQLNRCNFRTWIPTGSLSAYCLQYQHYQRTQDLVHVVWTIRGSRPVTLSLPEGSRPAVFDAMDNPVASVQANGTLTFTIGPEPRFVQGLTNAPQITLGPASHDDAVPLPDSRRLVSLGDGSWSVSDKPDTDYADSNFHQIRRFPGKMTVKPADAPVAMGGKALAIHLETQEVARFIMPYYTALVPRKAVEIPGKASHLGLWVHADSDWGRVVYSLRDAKGERWISVGTRDEWNADDIHNWSVFCFDGWRYLRFELPANSPYDTFREHGSTWWGHYGPGDGIVDLPLRIEKVFVERRTHALYVNDPQPTRLDDVLLGDLYAEYEYPADEDPETVRLSRLRMPVPKGIPELGNPVRDLEAAGVGPAIRIQKTTLPEQEADGTRCYVHFDPVPDATGYDIWVSPYASGQGALKLGKGWKASGQMLRGLRQGTDFFLFLVYTDKDGKPSKPSPAYKIHLKDLFAMK